MDLGGRAAGRRVAAATLIAAAALALCACDGADPPVVTETPVPSLTATPSVSPSPSPSPSPAATLSAEELLALMPEGAELPNALGAQLTAVYFLEQYGPMFHAEDPAIWISLSTPDCGYCEGQVDNLNTVRANGWTASGGEISAHADSIDARIGGDGRAYVVLEADLAAAYLVKEESTPELAEAASRAEFTMRLDHVDGRWRVSGVMVEAVE